MAGTVRPVRTEGQRARDASRHGSTSRFRGSGGFGPTTGAAGQGPPVGFFGRRPRRSAGRSGRRHAAGRAGSRPGAKRYDAGHAVPGETPRAPAGCTQAAAGVGRDRPTTAAERLPNDIGAPPHSGGDPASEADAQDEGPRAGGLSVDVPPPGQGGARGTRGVVFRAARGAHGSPLPRRRSRAARNVLRSRQAMVRGPTPPGTGVR